MKMNIADEAFLAGMIHDMGILISLQLYPEKLREVCETAKKGGAAGVIAFRVEMNSNQNGRRRAVAR